MRRALSVALVSATLALAACAPTRAVVVPERGGVPLRVGIVTAGGAAAAGYASLAEGGRFEAERDLGVITSVSDVTEPEEYARGLADFAEGGYDLVVAVGPPFEHATWQVARQFPDVRFALVDGAPEDDRSGTEDLPNVSNLMFAENEAGYLAGTIAGAMAHERVGSAIHDTVCAMGDVAVPRTDRFIAGFRDAVNTISPTTRVLVTYSNGPGDQARALEIGLEHVSQGCDILFDVAVGTGYIAAASAKGVYAIGAGWDRSGFAPETVIASAVKRVDRAIYATVKELRDGRFTPRDVLFDASRDGVGYGTLGSAVPASARAAVDQAIADIRIGRIKPKSDLGRP
ncbi:MAG: BMP family protein [Candidatus Limnocylindria bacterium]